MGVIDRKKANFCVLIVQVGLNKQYISPFFQAGSYFLIYTCTLHLCAF